MSHATNKVKWCLRKAEKELKEGDTHRGLVKIKPDIELAGKHISKADHYLQATEYLKKENFSDICASTMFYAMYHSLSAIAAKFGYESRNQECTFALITGLMRGNPIGMDEKLMNRISALDAEKVHEATSTEIRELYQYGTPLKIGDDLYEDMFELAKEVISKAKEIIKG